VRDAEKVGVVRWIVPEFKVLYCGVRTVGDVAAVVVVVCVILTFGEVQWLDVCLGGTRVRTVVVVAPCGADECWSGFI